MGPKNLKLAVLKEITNDFSDERKLGAGSFGKVYLGEYENGQKVAVKLLYCYGLESDSTQFQNEFDSLMKLEHPNIVRLMGYCYEIQHEAVLYEGKIVLAEKPTRALCLEYLHNGSLRRHLSNEELEWHTRYKIIKGTCEGLKYIHWELKQPVLHLDLKPDNILLDENMMPKLADFGLSRICDQGTQMTSSLIGTHGYQPPEYMDENLISKEFDIFSLGVVMLKIIKAGHSDYIFDDMDSENFVDTVQRRWRSKLNKRTHDCSLLDAYCRQVKICTEIALECLEHEKTKRPNILEIICKLNAMENELNLLGNNKGSHTEKEPLMVMTASSDGEGQGAAQVAYVETVPRTSSYSCTTTIGPTGLTLTVLKQITGGFSEERKLGAGSIGKVYLGEYENGKRIAVKIFDYDRPDAEQFQNEFDNLMKLEHPNIVRLIDYCYETQYEAVPYKGRLVMTEKTTRALCLEYLHNGSLERHLSNEELEWNTRYRIIKGTCEGLKYIHIECDALHLNLKPANILLDEHMVPKLADLGLSEIFNGCIGNRGYQPPEYIDRRLISKKFDIFSLGVVILRIVAGNRGCFRDLGTRTRVVFPRNSKTLGITPEQFVDAVQRDWRSRLDQETSDGSLLNSYCQQVKRCTEIALKCVEHERIRRPNIVEIIDMLNEMEKEPLRPPPPPPPPGYVSGDALDESKVHAPEGLAETNDEVRRGPKSELLRVYPLQLRFRLKPSSSLLSSTLELTNTTDDRVAFRFLSKGPIRDFEGPTCGVLPPKSRLTLTLTLRRQVKSGECFELVSTRAGDGDLLVVAQNPHALDFLYQHSSFINNAREAGREVHSVNLPADVCTQMVSVESIRRMFVDCFGRWFHRENLRRLFVVDCFRLWWASQGLETA